jgi:uncharacterized protein
MSRIEQVRIPLTNEDNENGSLLIQVIPNNSDPLLWDYTADQDFDPAMNPIQVLELEEDIYTVELNSNPTVVSCDKPELFTADYRHGKIGRFRPGLNVGQIRTTFFADGQKLGSIDLEVLSRKLSYNSDYRVMLKDIAGLLTDLIADRFAPSEQTFRPSADLPSRNLYQQFAFVRAYVTSAEFHAAILRVLKYPDKNWQRIEELQTVERGLRGSSNVLKVLLAPGRRKPLANHPTLSAVPAVIVKQSFTEDEDTPENQFVYQVLRGWYELSAEVALRVSRMSASASQARGLAETAEVTGILTQVLSKDLFSSLSPLSSWPSSSTVLQKKQGYRDIYRHYLQSQLGSQLTWEATEDIYGAGQKNVALLYEYWCFLQLCSILSGLCDKSPLDLRALVERSPEGLSLRLRQGKRVAITGTTERNGSRIQVALFYNKSFVSSAVGHEGSWTREMVPDFSFRIRALREKPTTTWLHFDAKYRVESVTELFGPGSPLKRTGKSVRYKREDLLRMHAYKDAVRRSTGAYILFPGDDSTLFREFHEIVPGIGAFALRPSESGTVGIEGTRSFISDVIDVLARP